MAPNVNLTSANFCYLDRDNRLITRPTTVEHDLCAQPNVAAVDIANRRIMIVAVMDMVELRKQLIRIMADKK